MRQSLHNDDDLESFLHKQVADHRMFPSDQLWRNIQKELHGEGKWPALTYISIFIIAALAVCTMMVKPEERLHKNTIVYATAKEEPAVEKTSASEKGKDAITPVQYAYSDRLTQQTMESVSEAIIARTEKATIPAMIDPAKEPVLALNNNPKEEQTTIQPEANAKAVAPSKPLEEIQDNTTTNNTIQQDAKTTALTTVSQFASSKPASRYFSTIGLMNLSDLKVISGQPPHTSLYNNDEIWRTYPLTNANDLWRRKLSKFSFQFYITPSISYRRLNDANGKTARAYTALPRTASYQVDINHVVQHQAQMGAEVGFALGYKLTNTLTAKGGFQFNVRQYGIKAYTVPMAQRPEETNAENGVGSLPSTPDEVAVRNAYFTSATEDMVSKPVVLSNRYYELSVPVGIDWRILSSGNGRLTVNAAASLQPTYTFDKEPFVVTTNYKSYTEGASIMRNWNLNSNVEAYVSYKMGPFRWQLGPQFRYQHFSTYSNAYPIREHLLDYGLKIGFTKSID